MEKINKDYNLPQEFYEYIEQYIRGDDKRQTINDPKVLFALWNKAIVVATEFPDMRESIAEWTVSSASRSPLLEDNYELEAIHNTFGSLEDKLKLESDDEYSTRWKEISTMIDRLYKNS